MIRVELLGRRRWVPWSKALLAALVVCGGLYGIHQVFPALAGSLFDAGSTPSAAVPPETTPNPVAEQEAVPPSSVAQTETTQAVEQKPAESPETIPNPVAEQEAVPPSSVAQAETTQAVEQKPAESQETTPNPVAEQEAVAPSSVAQTETTQAVEQKPAAQPETTPNPVAGQEAVAPSSVVQQEAIPSSEMQPETASDPSQAVEQKPAEPPETPPSSVAQQELTPQPAEKQEAVAAQPETASDPSQAVEQETLPPVNPGVQPEAASRPAASVPTTRSTACHQVMRIDEQVPAGIRVGSLICDSTGEYRLEGTGPSHKVLREFRLRLQALPSRVSFSTWREERTLRFAFQGHFAERPSPPLAALSSGQAAQFLGKVAHWADASGLDSLSIHKPIHTSLSAERTHQRQKLRGIGSPQQISTFLHQFQQSEAVATLGEILLMPVKSDDRGWVQARLYAAVDILVEVP